MECKQRMVSDDSLVLTKHGVGAVQKEGAAGKNTLNANISFISRKNRRHLLKSALVLWKKTYEHPKFNAARA